MIGRVHLLRGTLDVAEAVLEESLEAARRENWTAFTPWPSSLLADAELARGDVTAAEERYEHSYALGCHLGDPCWEGIAGRGRGSVAAMRGDVRAAMECFVDARTRATRLPDAYRWVDGYILDALCGLGVAHDIDATRGWIGQLAALAERTGMRELAVRAYVHRGRLGDESALAAGRALQATIDNPALDALTTSSAARG